MFVPLTACACERERQILFGEGRCGEEQEPGRGEELAELPLDFIENWESTRSTSMI